MTDDVRVRYRLPPERAEELNRFAADLARKHGIDDTALLARVLVKAAFDSAVYGSGGGWARAGGRHLPVIGETVAARDRITALVDRLDGELAGAHWPLDGADELRAALGALPATSQCDWLGNGTGLSVTLTRCFARICAGSRRAGGGWMSTGAGCGGG